MKLTKIKCAITGNKLNPTELNTVGEALVLQLAQFGFITDYAIISSSHIKLGLQRRSFKINTAKIGYNAKIGQWISSKKGYRRTDVPTWDQRVAYNNIVNFVLDKYKVSCKVTSSQFIIREHVIKEFEAKKTTNLQNYL